MKKLAKYIVRSWDSCEEDKLEYILEEFPEHKKALLEWSEMPFHYSEKEGVEQLLPLLIKYSTKLGRVLE